MCVFLNYKTNLKMHADATARALTDPHPDPLAQPTLCAAAGEATPPSPASPGRGRGPRHWHWPLTAVVLLVVIQPELLTVVRTTDQVSLAASVSVILPAVPRAITVTLPLVTRVLWGAASPAIEISSGTSLT